MDRGDQGKNVLGGEARVFPPLGFPSTATFRHFRSYYLIFTSDRESAKDQKNTRSLLIKKKQTTKTKKKKHANEESENGGVEAYTFI